MIDRLRAMWNGAVLCAQVRECVRKCEIGLLGIDRHGMTGLYKIILSQDSVPSNVIEWDVQVCPCESCGGGVIVYVKV